MKTIIKTKQIKTITMIDGDRSAKFKLVNGETAGFSSNMPYEKIRADWEFYAKVIRKM